MNPKPKKAFDQHANVFNKLQQCVTFITNHRGAEYVPVKVGRKFVPVTKAFANQMGLRIAKVASAKLQEGMK